MKTWWLETAWPWLKENWWVLLILPVIVVVAVAMWSSRLFGVFSKKSLQTIDPTAAADKRALEEAQKRRSELARENEQLARDLAKVRAKYDRLRRLHDKKLEDQVDELRQDPERLRALMLKVGRDE